ncbi:hypothetical protein [Leeuwenhoekiella sp. H156]|uniref:hypothetical protein n=1 Tax=Leeuwenhoekiella sp. H156 TaxID=3450128 RepID=UPI003FA4163D
MKGLTVKELERFKMLAAIGVLLIAINFIAVLFFPTDASRVIRFAGSTVLNGYFLIVFPAHRKKLIITLIAFWFRDIAAIFYEDGTNDWGFFICGGIAYLSLFIRQLKSLWRFKIITPSITITGFVVLACFVILYSLESVLDMAEHDRDLIYYFYFLGISIVFLILLAVYYYYRIGGVRALSFSFAVFAFTISDIAAYFGVYMEDHLFFLVTRTFYLAGLIMLMNYAITRPDAGEEDLVE